MRSAHLVSVVFVIALGAALRIYWNDVAVFSDHDETVYLRSAQTVASDWLSYPSLVRGYLTSQELQDQTAPLPSRWGGVFITAAACTIGPCTYRTLTWVETLAGIIAMPLTYGLARRLFGRTAAWLAVAFTAVAPIQLAMGRRALEDELLLVAILVALWATAWMAGIARFSAWRSALAIGAYVFAFAMKEIFLLYYPALLAALVLLRGNRRVAPSDLALFGLPPLIYAAVFGLASGDPLALVTFAGLQQSGRANLYIQQYQSGPAHEPLADIFLLGPLIAVIGIAGVGMTIRDLPRRHEAIAVAAFFGLLLAAYAIVPKDARYFMAGDAGLRLLAAWAIASFAWLRPGLTPLLTVGTAVVNALIELPIFGLVFIRNGVQDPILSNILKAFGAIPR
jgi:uncharacterized membrane protein